jgi:DNA ligase-1
VQQSACLGVDHLREELARIEELGGEGLMLREPGSSYIAGRSHTLLKVKSFFDSEATVTGHTKGRGRHKGRCGALEVRWSDGTEFKVGTGLSDKQRENPPKVGDIVSFRYQELTKAGVPRFPSFIGVRHDVKVK